MKILIKDIGEFYIGQDKRDVENIVHEYYKKIKNSNTKMYIDIYSIKIEENNDLIISVLFSQNKLVLVSTKLEYIDSITDLINRSTQYIYCIKHGEFNPRENIFNECKSLGLETCNSCKYMYTHYNITDIDDTRIIIKNTNNNYSKTISFRKKDISNLDDDIIDRIDETVLK